MLQNAILIFTSLAVTSSAHAARIAYIGDSQSAAPYGLFQQLRNGTLGGHQLVNGRAVCSARIEDFVTRVRTHGCGNMQLRGGAVSYSNGRSSTALVNSLMEGSDTVIVQLGDNHLGEPSVAARQAIQMAERILSSGRNCIWIGPAAAATSCAQNRSRKQIVSNSIRDALASLEVRGRSCRFINSFSATSNGTPAGDCLHFSNATGYRTWANRINSSLQAALSTGAAAETDSQRAR